MSSVRMCDTCGNIFSENKEGWTTGTISRKVKENGRTTFKEQVQDACPDCSSAMFDETPVPRVALPAPSRVEREYARQNGAVDTVGPVAVD